MADGKRKRHSISRIRKVSRRDVAQAAGVSVTTVTHALNPVPGVRVSPETAARVTRIAREMGYRPNFVGKALVKGRTMAAAILLPSTNILAYQLHQDLMLGMATAMEADDYHLLLLFRSDDHRYLSAVTQGRADGIFILQSDTTTEHINKIVNTGIPTVVVNVNWHPAPTQVAGCVRSDHETMAKNAVEEFIKLGCKTILLIIDSRWIDANQITQRSFIEETGAQAGSGIVGSVIGPYRGDARLQIHNALASGQRWDGILTDLHADADAFVEEAAVHGLAPGRDFHLITTDTKDGQTSQSGAEQLTYTQQPGKVGAEAWKLLRALIEGDEHDATVRVPYRAYGTE